MINPISYTDKVVRDFLRYQLTAYPFTDPGLRAQMRRLLSIEHTSGTPLMKGPFITLSKPFADGDTMASLCGPGDGQLHPHLAQLHPYDSLYGHQARAIRQVLAGKSVLVSTGTGSGKTEAFLYPIISKALRLRDQGAPPGISAVIVYPMNALAEDQLDRLRELLVGTGVTFGMYVGKTPETPERVTGKRLAANASKGDYHAAIRQRDAEDEAYAIHPPEERPSRQEMRENPPRILLTNVKQLELLLTRQKDIELFSNATLDFLVVDEAHTFSGAPGAETAVLLRRLKSFCGKANGGVSCIATSATISDPERGADAGREFVSRFFGVPQDQVEVVTEEYREDEWAPTRRVPAPPADPASNLHTVLELLEQEDPSSHIDLFFRTLTGERLEAARWKESLFERLSSNELVYQLAAMLRAPMPLESVLEELGSRIGRTVTCEELLTWLALGSAARKHDRPLLRPVVHGFITGVSGAVVDFPMPSSVARLWLSAEDATVGEDGQQLLKLPVLTCTTCGQHYFEHHVAGLEWNERGHPMGGEAVGEHRVWAALDASNGGTRVVLLDHLSGSQDNGEIDSDASDDDEDDQPTEDFEQSEMVEIPRHTSRVYACRWCGAIHDHAQPSCAGCGRDHPLVPLIACRPKAGTPRRPLRFDERNKLGRCVSCGKSGVARFGPYREPIRPVRATTVADVHVLAQSMLKHQDDYRRRLLVFTDNRQEAAFQAGWMQDHARRYRLRALIYQALGEDATSIGDLVHWLDAFFEQNRDLSRTLLREVWEVASHEAAGTAHKEQRKLFLRLTILRELVLSFKQRIGLEPWGRLKVRYLGLTEDLPAIQKWSKEVGLGADELIEGIQALLDNERRRGILRDETRLFSRMQGDGDPEVQHGYVPKMKGIPRGLVLSRDANHHKGRIAHWISTRGDSTGRQFARGLGVDTNQVEEFLTDVWALLTET